MSTPILLSQAIKSFLEPLLADGVSVRPRVYEGYLPKLTSANADAEDFPYVIIRIHKGSTGADGNPVVVNLILGTKCEAEDGFKDVLMLFDRIQTALFKTRVLDRQFRLELPYEWELFEDQPYPEWIGKIKTTWILPTITEEVEGI